MRHGIRGFHDGMTETYRAQSILSISCGVFEMVEWHGISMFPAFNHKIMFFTRPVISLFLILVPVSVPVPACPSQSSF